MRIVSTLESLEKISIYDILGRTLFESQSIQNQEYVIPGLSPLNQTLILKIVMNNGQVVIRKVHF